VIRAIIFLAAVAASVCPAKAAEPAVVTAGLGMYDFIPNDNRAPALHLQYRFSDDVGSRGDFLGLKPLIGGMVNGDKGAFGFAGLAAPFMVGGIEIEPSAGVGAYHRGDSTNLGGTFEFHLGLGAAKRIGDGVRLGVAMTHISNANLHRKNRGTNVLMVTLGRELR
jgi:lipid A 3-O-deacylase